MLPPNYSWLFVATPRLALPKKYPFRIDTHTFVFGIGNSTDGVNSMELAKGVIPCACAGKWENDPRALSQPGS